ncbi:MAG: helix-turn-helix transcriptional regulator [Dehalococcoidia bacterium]|nr:helix-turn-helix transcriptional regulator [Dehalococcoidia bacterium]
MEESKVNDLSSWLKQKCRREGLSLRQAAIKTGLSHSTLCDIVKGESNLSGQTITKLARYFGGDGKRKLVLEDQLLVLAVTGHSKPATCGHLKSGHR